MLPALRLSMGYGALKKGLKKRYLKDFLFINGVGEAFDKLLVLLLLLKLLTNICHVPEQAIHNTWSKKLRKI